MRAMAPGQAGVPQFSCHVGSLGPSSDGKASVLTLVAQEPALEARRCRFRNTKKAGLEKLVLLRWHGPGEVGRGWRSGIWWNWLRLVGVAWGEEGQISLGEVG